MTLKPSLWCEGGFKDVNYAAVLHRLTAVSRYVWICGISLLPLIDFSMEYTQTLNNHLTIWHWQQLGNLESPFLALIAYQRCWERVKTMIEMTAKHLIPTSRCIVRILISSHHHAALPPWVSFYILNIFLMRLSVSISMWMASPARSVETSMVVFKYILIATITMI